MKKTDDLFDVSMGSADGAEVCELIGLYMLSLLEPQLQECSGGLYRDDGILVSKLYGQRLERLKKRIVKVFKDKNLGITIDSGMPETEFLDIEFDLPNAIYRPYVKPNHNPMYIHIDSNHHQ